MELKPDPDDIERWVSAPRFDVYRRAASDAVQARDLYLSDVLISGALMEDFHFLEIVVRNRIDAVLSQHSQSDWLQLPSVLTAQAIKLVNESRQRVAKTGPPHRDRVLAGLSFGFWTALFGHRYGTLWVQSLHQSVRPAGPRLRRDVARVLEELRLLRNRIAHHEPLLRVPISERAEQIVTATEWFDESAGAFLRNYSRVPALLAERPDP